MPKRKNETINQFILRKIENEIIEKCCKYIESIDGKFTGKAFAALIRELKDQ
jgi:hypothetical protein